MKVKFVNINGEVMALFPTEVADLNGNILSYMHIGQHGAASPKWMDEPGLFDPDLYQELLEIGYEDLEIIDMGNILEMIEGESSYEQKRIFLW